MTHTDVNSTMVSKKAVCLSYVKERFLPASRAATATTTTVKHKSLSQDFIASLGLQLVNSDSETVIEALLSGGRKRATFVNAHCCNVMRRNPDYAAAVETSDIRLPDGIGVEIAARLSGVRLTENLNGTDLLPKLLARAAALGKSVFLLGGTPGTADAAAARLYSDIPKLRIAGSCNGYEDVQDTKAVLRRINDSGADIVLVAMGVPQQDIWLARHADQLNASLVMGVGAFFDFVAGNVTRAPLVVRNARMEWAWRLALEPRRLAGRYVVGNLTFMAHTLWNGLMQSKHRQSLTVRGLDIALSLTALALLAPLFLTIATLIRLDSAGPVFFRQNRVGQYGTMFSMLKFRTMVQDAEAQRVALLNQSTRDGICFKNATDPRITRVGHFLRRSSMDELPQLINVLLGNMSIVGPRPALPSEVANYPKRAMARLAVKPGITGLWQVSGRADISFDKMIDMDLAYIRSRSVVVDMILIVLTAYAVIGRRGAY